MSEDFLKWYVAYRAETNFVDVQPQANSLRLTFNIPFADLVDPRGLARDVTDVGTLGNGDADLRVERPDQITYAVGLARQALERQIGGQDETLAA